MRPTSQLDLPAAIAASLLQRLLLLGVLVLLVAGLTGCGPAGDRAAAPAAGDVGVLTAARAD